MAAETRSQFERGVQHIYTTVRGMIDAAITARLGNVLTGNKVNATALPLGSGLAVSGGQIVATGGTGTVTSVGITAPAIFSVSGSPITGTGSITISLATQAVGTVWAGPTSGSPAAPTFRFLVATDIPNLPASIVTSGTFSAARIPVMVGSGASHAPGAVPDPPSVAGVVKFLREDGSWNVPAGSALTDATLTTIGGLLADVAPVTGHPIAVTRLDDPFGSHPAAAQPHLPIAGISLIDCLRGAAHNLATSTDILEYDFQWYNGVYYVARDNGAATKLGHGSTLAAAIAVAIGGSPDATISTRYPSLLFFAGTWHVWGYNGSSDVRHFTASSFGGTYTDVGGIGHNYYDPQVRLDPRTGTFYMAVSNGTPTSNIRMLSSTDLVSWTDLGAVFATIGTPPWAPSQYDPTPVFWNGRTMVFFAANDGTTRRIGAAEVDPSNNMNALWATALVTPSETWETGGTSNPILLDVPGQPGQERVYYIENNGTGYIQAGNPPSDGRRFLDALRLDLSTGLDVAAGLVGTAHGGAAWGRTGLICGATPSGAYGQLNVSALADFTLAVDFKLGAIPGSGYGMLLSAVPVGGTPPVVALFVSSAGVLYAIVQQASGVGNLALTGVTVLTAGTRQRAVLRKFGTEVRLYLGTNQEASGTHSAALLGLGEWHLANDKGSSAAAGEQLLCTVYGAVIAGEALPLDLDPFLGMPVCADFGSIYTLPVATASVLGGVKRGSGTAIAGDGTISATGTFIAMQTGTTAPPLPLWSSDGSDYVYMSR